MTNAIIPPPVRVTLPPMPPVRVPVIDERLDAGARWIFATTTMATVRPTRGVS
jgi:hypothetical protein